MSVVDPIVGRQTVRGEGCCSRSFSAIVVGIGTTLSVFRPILSKFAIYFGVVSFLTLYI